MRTIPLVKPHLPRLEDIEDPLRKMLASGQLTNFGPFSQTFERRICDFLGVKHAVCVSSATTGLTLLLNTLPKDSEVLVPSFTFLPTVHAISWNSLVPVFADIDVRTYTISPELVAPRISKKTAAILAVNAFGAPSAIEELEILAKEAHIRLFFDSAHALGAKHRGKHLGSFGNAEVFSLSATKLLPCGEGGLITTDDESIYEAILDRRNYGLKHNSYDSENLGLNGKLTEFSAILGIQGLDSLDERVQRRNEIARKYIRGLSSFPGLGFQVINAGDISTYKDFAVTVEPKTFGVDKTAFRSELGKRGIETASYFSPAIHQMTYFRGMLSRQAQLANTDHIEKRIVSLPIYSDLMDQEIEYIVKSIAEVHENARA